MKHYASRSELYDNERTDVRIARLLQLKVVLHFPHEYSSWWTALSLLICRITDYLKQNIKLNTVNLIIFFLMSAQGNAAFLLSSTNLKSYIQSQSPVSLYVTIIKR